jgi:hypothetical protein
MRILPIAAVALLPAGAAHAQTYGCDSPESRQFDFWLGEWELSYSEEGKPGRSRNRVSKILGGCAVLEEFSGQPGTKLDGRSHSTYDRLTRQWRQTWVDNTAAYLDFTGGMSDGRMILSRDAPGGKGVQQRMIFQDITSDSLKWLWQKSEDGGASWKTQWEIDYRRVK